MSCIDNLLKINGIAYSFYESFSKQDDQTNPDYIGHGGNGSVFKATVDANNFAIKRIELRNKDKTYNRRVINEVNYCISPPADRPKSIIEILGYTKKKAKGKTYLYYVMPLCKKTLRQKINDRDISQENAFQILLELCEVLVYIHKDGVIHRDIKPENVLIDDSDNAVLSDFGIAHIPNRGNLTREFDKLGNREYFAPEQKNGSDATLIGSGADVYSLGLIANELFTFEKPMGSAFKKVGDMYPYLSAIDALIDRMTHPDPDSRVSAYIASKQLEGIQNNLKDEKENVTWSLGLGDADTDIGVACASAVESQAVDDVTLASYLLQNLEPEEWDKFNLSNYHCNVMFEADSALRAACVCLLIYKNCKLKLHAESVSFRDGFPNFELSKPEQCDVFIQELEKIRPKMGGNVGRALDSIYEKTLQSFYVCKSYHCDEVISYIPEAIKTVEEALAKGSAIYIAYWLKTKAANLLSPVDEFYLADFLKMLPAESASLDSCTFRERSRMELLYKLEYANENRRATDALERLKKTWDSVVYDYRGEDYDVFVYFDSEEQYNDFRDRVIGAVKGDYILEGDVEKLICRTDEVRSAVELKLDIFDVTATLPKVFERFGNGNTSV